MSVMTHADHEIIETEINGFTVHKCTNPNCDLKGRESWVRQRAGETDCPYKINGQTYVVTEQ